MPSRVWSLAIRLFGKGQNAQEIAQANRQLKSVGDTAKRTSTQLKGTSTAYAGLARAFAAIGGGALVAQGLRNVIRTGVEFQNLQVRLETFTGSAMAARAEMDRFAKIAAETPFMLQSVTEAAIGLTARGFDPTTESLRALGDMAAAQGKSIETAMQAVTQAAFGEAEMLKQFGIIMRQQGDEVRITYDGVTQTIKKDSAEIFNALTSLAKVEFAGAAERQSKTLAGALSTLQGNVDVLTASLANDSGLIAALTRLTKVANEAASDSAGVGLLTKVVAAATLPFQLLAVGVERLEKILRNNTFAVFWRSLGDGQKEIEKAKDSTINWTAASESLVDSLAAQVPTLKEVEDQLRNNAEAAFAYWQEVETLKQVWQDAADTMAAQDLGTIPTAGPGGAMPMASTEIATAYTIAIQAAFRDHTAWEIFEDRLREAWQNASDTILEILGDAFFAAGRVLIDALRSRNADGLENAFANLGGQAGAQIGNRIGEEIGKQMVSTLGAAFAGPLGALLGSVLGEMIGRSLGKVLTSILSLFGLTSDPQRIMGSFSVGPGANVPGSNTNLMNQFFSGIGGTEQAQSVGRQMMEQIEQIFTTIQDAIGATLNLTQTMIVSVRRDGSAILEIVDGTFRRVIGVFGTVQEAMEAGIAQLLSTAFVNSEHVLAAAFSEVLGRAADIGVDAVVAQIQTLAGLAQELEQMINPQDAVLARLAAMRAELESLNLSAAAAAPLLAQLAEAERRRMEAIGRSVLGEMAAMANELGVATQFARRVQRALLRARFIEWRIQLEQAGLWQQYRGVFQQLRREALAASRAVADTATALGTLGSVGFGGSFVDSDDDMFRVEVTNFDEMARELSDAEFSADLVARQNQFLQQLGLLRLDPGSRRIQEAINQALQFIASIEQGNVLEKVTPELKEEFVIRSIVDALRGLSEGDLAAAIEYLGQQGFDTAQILQMLGDEATQVVSDFSRIIDSLREFRMSLEPGGGSPFASGTPAEQAFQALANFQGVVEAINAGDLSQLGDLQGLAQIALSLNQDAFGNATQLFQDALAQVTAGLDLVLSQVDLPDAQTPVSAINSLEDTTYAGLRRVGDASERAADTVLPAILEQLVAIKNQRSQEMV